MFVETAGLGEPLATMVAPVPLLTRVHRQMLAQRGLFEKRARTEGTNQSPVRNTPALKQGQQLIVTGGLCKQKPI